jgi:hypothetical protein
MKSAVGFPPHLHQYILDGKLPLLKTLYKRAKK